ncbi:MAG: uroporphyrinogen-III synthase [Rhizobiaceae bacterium]
MIRRVLVTRPEPEASKTAEQLKMLGFEPLVLPLTTTGATPDQTVATGVDAVVVTSSNALRYASPELLAALVAKPCFAVGDKTAEQARAAGFGSTVSAKGDADALAQLVLRQTAAEARIAYLCGVVRRPEFESTVVGSGRTIIPVETYDTRRVDYSDAMLKKAFRHAGVDAALIYSAESASALSRLSEKPIVADRLSGALFCCLSARVAAALDIESSRIRIAERPEQQALFDVLKAGG